MQRRDYDIFVVKLDTAGTFQWAVSAGSTDKDYGLSIAVDGSGNVYVTGLINSAGAANYTVDFDPGVGTYDVTAGRSAYLWKLTQI